MLAICGAAWAGRVGVPLCPARRLRKSAEGLGCGRTAIGPLPGPLLPVAGLD
jgi:hypothetical protein